jgi:hypothetical protein
LDIGITPVRLVKSSKPVADPDRTHYARMDAAQYVSPELRTNIPATLKDLGGAHAEDHTGVAMGTFGVQIFIAVPSAGNTKVNEWPEAFPELEPCAAGHDVNRIDPQVSGIRAGFCQWLYSPNNATDREQKPQPSTPNTTYAGEPVSSAPNAPPPTVAPISAFWAYARIGRKERTAKQERMSATS